jgi:hypothetical protein
LEEEATAVLDQQRADGIEPPAELRWSTRIERLCGRRVSKPPSDPLLLVAPCPDCGTPFITAVLKKMNRYQQHNKDRAEAKGQQWNHPVDNRSTRCDHCEPGHRRKLAAASARKRRAAAAAQRSAICQHCGITFTPQRSTARFCSTVCRVASHRAANSNVI